MNGHKRQPSCESQTGQTTGLSALKDPPHLHRDTHFSADAARAGLSTEGGFLEGAQRAPENTEGGMGQGTRQAGGRGDTADLGVLCPLSSQGWPTCRNTPP